MLRSAMRRGLAAVMIGWLLTGCDRERPPPVIDHGVAVMGVSGVLRTAEGVLIEYWMVFAEPIEIPFCGGAPMLDVESLAGANWIMKPSACALEDWSEEQVPVDDTVRGALSVPTGETGQLRFVLTGSIGDSAIALRGPVIDLTRRW
jgi:hypothetical protein